MNQYFIRSIFVGLVMFNTAISILNLCLVEAFDIKIGASISSFFIGLVMGLLYYFYFERRGMVIQVIRELCLNFKTDINTLFTSALAKDLKTLNT